MTVTVVTRYYYPITDTPNNKVNTAILKQEIEDASLSVTVSNVTSAGSNILIDLAGDASAADITLVDAVIAAHQGDDFVDVPIFETEVASIDDDTGSEAIRVTMTTGALASGDYNLIWMAEHKVNSNTGATGSVASLYYSKNGDTPAQFNQNCTILDQWVAFNGTYPIEVKDGDSWVFTVRHKRIGTSGNASWIRRARLALTKVN